MNLQGLLAHRVDTFTGIEVILSQCTRGMSLILVHGNIAHATLILILHSIVHVREHVPYNVKSFKFQMVKVLWIIKGKKDLEENSLYK